MITIPTFKFLPSVLIALLTALSVTNLQAQSQATTETPTPVAPALISYEVLQQRPHSTDNFTQGLFFYDGHLYESTGHYGRSRLLRYDEEIEQAIVTRPVAAKYFAEGATAHQGLIYQLTWRAETALAYEPRLLGKQDGFSYEGEGWGLTSDGEYLWMSDGSSTLEKLDIDGTVITDIEVTANGRPVNRLNELEWVEGKIFANRWYDNHIFVIDPESGNVVGYMDLNQLAKPEQTGANENVLNGIAWNSDTQSLWVTGKNWQSLYELRLVDPN